MNSVDTYLKLIKDKMNKLEKEYEIVCGDLETLDKNYTSAKSQLLARKEQIRGAYTVLNEQITNIESDVGLEKNHNENKFNANDINNTEDIEDSKVDNNDSIINMIDKPSAIGNTVENVINKKINRKENIRDNKSKTDSINDDEKNKGKNKGIGSLTSEQIDTINKVLPKEITNGDNVTTDIPFYLADEYRNKK